jgi:hypothetical protein
MDQESFTPSCNRRHLVHIDVFREKRYARKSRIKKTSGTPDVFLISCFSMNTAIGGSWAVDEIHFRHRKAFEIYVEEKSRARPARQSRCRLHNKAPGLNAAGFKSVRAFRIAVMELSGRVWISWLPPGR